MVGLFAPSLPGALVVAAAVTCSPNVPSRNHAGASNSGSVTIAIARTARPFTVEQLTHFLRCRTTRLRLSGVSSVLGSASVPRSRCRLLHSSGDWSSRSAPIDCSKLARALDIRARALLTLTPMTSATASESSPCRSASSSTSRSPLLNAGSARSTSERASAASSSVPGSSLMTVTVS